MSANPEVISTAAELLATLRKAESFVMTELEVRRLSYAPSPDEDQAEDIADAENTLKLIRAAIAKVGSGCD